MTNVLLPQLTVPSRLSPFDLALVALYLVAITLFGLRFRNKSGDKSLKNYFLANNTIPWWAIALSIVSAETSTLTIISIPGVAFAGDFGFLQVVLGYMLGRVVVAFLFLPRYFRGEMLTAYQLIDQRFGPRLHKLTAGLFLMTRAAAEGVRVFAISIVVGIAIGTGDTLSIAIISALTLLYTFEGGMAAVIWTDVVQMGLYVAGTLVAIWTLGAHAGGWTHIHAVAAPLGKFHWLDFSLTLTRSYTFWAGVLGGTFLTMASHGTDQLMVQRLLAARNLRESRLALLSSGAVIFLQFTLFLLIGVGLYVFYGQHPQAFASTDRIFPSFIVQQMPHGVAGLLVAAILAAAMSNLSAALNSLASTTVIDFYVPWKTRVPQVSTLRPGLESPRNSTEGTIPGAPSFEPHPKGGLSSEARLPSPTDPQPPDPQPPAPQPPAPALPDTTNISRAATLFWALVLFAIAVYSIHAGQHGHVVEIALSIASVAYGCLLGVFLLGTLTRYATQTGTIIGMLVGFLTNLALWQLPHAQTTLAGHHLAMPQIAFTWYVLIGSLMTFAVGTLFSLILPRPRLRQTTAAVLLIAFTLSASAQGFQRPPAPAQNLVILSGGTRSLIASAAVEGPASPSSDPDFTPIDTLLTAAIAAKKLPGAVVIIGHNGHIVFHHAYGNRKLANEPDLEGYPSPPEPMTEDTLFDMASLTKVMVTTVAILQLVEQGKLDLDAPVSKYLPAFTTTTGTASLEAGVLSSPSQTLGAPSIASSAMGAISNSQSTAYKSQITIRNLLTHYSGLPEDISLKDPWGLAKPDKLEGIRRALAAIPYGPPGVTFKYSDINFITLGALVEKISGQPLNVYATDHIFNPLKTSSTYHAFAEACPANAIASGAALELPPPTHTNGQPGTHRTYTCASYQWDLQSIADTAPTAHDNEGTAVTNPNYDKLLRGTVHDPTTRRMGGVAGHAGLFSTAADAATFCQALLDKLLKNTGPFPLKQSTLQQALRPQAPAGAVATATIFTQSGDPTKGVAQRALGWDLNSAFSRPRGEIFPITTGPLTTGPGGKTTGHPGSFGHTGFTGTSLWLDPTTNTYVILLANAIHPRGAPPISPLRGQLATAAAKALGLTITAAGAPSFEPHPKGGVSSKARPLSSTPANIAIVTNKSAPSSSPANIAIITNEPALSPTPANIVILSEDPRSPTARTAVEGPAFPPTPANIVILSEGPRSPTATIAVEGPAFPPTPAHIVILSEVPRSPTARAAVEGPAFPPTRANIVILSEVPRSPTARAAVEGPAFPPTPANIVILSEGPHSPTVRTAVEGPAFSSAPANIVILSEGPRSPTARTAVEGPAFPPNPAQVPSKPTFLRIAYQQDTPKTPAQKTADRKALKAELKGTSHHDPATSTGIDVLEQTHYAALLALAKPHLRIALLTNQSGLDQTGHRTIDLLLHADPRIELKEIFTPEHGLLGKQDTESLKKEEDPTTHLPVISLYGAKPADRHPKQSDLKNIDAVVIDLQDAGVRFWTYTSVLGYFLEAAAKAKIEVIVLDRPNPVGGIAFGGPMSDPGTEFYANFMPTPVRHGMTFGELARFYNANAKQVDLDPALLDARAVSIGTPTTSDAPPATRPGLGAKLTVVPMQNWLRADYYENTGVPWTPPSPNLRTPRAAILYPAIGLIETTNISVGRGTETPFENIAAPYIDAKQLSTYLEARHISGVTVTPTTLTIAETPEHYPSHGQTIPGVHFEVTDPPHFDSPEFGIELLAALHHLYPTQFQLEKVKTLLCNAEVLAALKANKDPRDIAQTYQPTLKSFNTQRAQALLY